jgi:hypothetical protein
MLRPVTRLLRYRAGPTAHRLIREHGFDPGSIGAFVGPASGPKWLVLAGIDRAIIEAGLLTKESSIGGGRRPLLVGASAGAWRVLAMASPQPRVAHDAVLDGYVGQVFPRGVTPAEISASYRRMLSRLFPTPVARHIIDHPIFDVAVQVARARGAAGSSRRFLQAAAMVCAAALNVISAATMRLGFERILFHSRPSGWRPPFEGSVVALTEDNLLPAALASGTVPMYMEPVQSIPGAGRGRYIDGGLTDYHLNQDFADSLEELVLFPHFQERISPNWFDRYLPGRRPAPEAAANVLQLYPSDEFVASLPDQRIPTRDDFIEFVDDPERRIRRWREAASRSDALGEELLADIEQDRVPDLLEPM